MPDLYYDDDQIEALRQEALAGDDVVLSAQRMIELTSDWQSMRAVLEPASC